MTRKKVAIVGSAMAAVLVLAGAAAAAFVVLSGGKELPYKTQAELREMMPSMAAAELKDRGVSLTSPLRCEGLPGWTEKRLRVSCTGTTTGDKSVEVIGSGQLSTQDAYYTILVDGKPLVENVSCLGDACRKGESD